ncbi:MAG TPA: tetratricopeptide repeat protein [Herpetosiphonaceae bacterium]
MNRRAGNTPRVQDLNPNPPQRRVPATLRGRRGAAIVAVLGLIAVALLMSELGLLTTSPQLPPGEFVVRIAPFSSTGEDQRQGTIVAEQLLEALKTGITTPMNVGLLSQPITSAEQAQQIAEANGVDAIIWGEAAEGGTATQPILRPRLFWMPSEPFVPETWQGFEGHFVLPAEYDLALRDLNGAAILPRLLDGLNYFGRGDADKAADTFEDLRAEYSDVLRPELPSMVRAITFWAQGMLPSAEQEAQAALAAASRPEHWNNLGALRLDQQQFDPAREALMEALAANPNLAQAHANFGRLLLDEGKPAEALPDLRSAAQDLPASNAIAATLGEAYRRSGQLAASRQIFAAVLQREPLNGPAMTEQSMLALTSALTATGRLEWELEGDPTLSATRLAELRSQAETGIGEIEQLRNKYLRQANAYGVDGRRMMQRLSETQAARLEQELLNRRYQLMLIEIEQGRVLAEQPRSFLRRAMDTIQRRRTPLQQAIATSTAALRQEPSISLQYDYNYQQGRAAYLSNNSRLARTQWEETIKLAQAEENTILKNRPEAHYGLAQLLLAESRPEEARAELNTALTIEPQYFPAHELLAQLDERDQRWADAETHYRWLVERRPWDGEQTLRFVEVLRQQDKSADAEAILLPLANNNNVDALVALAALYRQSGKLDEAQAVLLKARNADPASAAVHEELAALALAREDFRAAENELRTALTFDPQRSSTHIALGRLYAHQLGQPAAAVEQFRAAVEIQSDDPLVYRQLGEALLEAGNAEAAEASFKKALQIAPGSHEAQHGLATAYLAQKQYAAAERAEQRALELANNNYTLALVGLADIDREQRRFEEATTRYNEALEKDPQLVGAYLGLGRTMLAQGHPELALTYFESGLEYAPKNMQLLLGKGEALLQQGDIAGAREIYTQVRQIDSGNAAASVGLGNILWKENKPNEALAALNEAVRLNPNDAETQMLLGEIYNSLNQPDAAIEAYTKAANVRDDWYEPRFRRGTLLLKLERNEAAIEDLEATIDLNPDFAQGYYWLGRAYRAAGEFEDAEAQFRGAIQRQPDYFEARYFLGRTLDELGRAPEARDEYQAILNEASASNQWHAEAQRELDRIQ